MWCIQYWNCSTYLKQIESMVFRQLFPAYESILTSRKLQSPTQSKNWKTGLYQGLDYRCEEDCDSDLNCLDSAILRQCTTVTTECFDCPWTERDVFSVAIIDLILRSSLVGFSLLRASYYYNLTGLVCYVYSVYNLWGYSELSIHVCFKLLQDTPDYFYLLLLCFYLEQTRHLIMICYYSSQYSADLKFFNNIFKWRQCFAADK